MIRIIFTPILILIVSSCLAQIKKEITLDVIEGTRQMFYCNDKLCNGYAIKHYSNGNIEISGTFRNGMAVGIVTSYYEDGNLEDKRYFKRGKLIRVYSFFKSGLLTRVLNWKKWESTEFIYDSTNQATKKIVGSLKIYHEGKSVSTTYLKRNGKWIKE